MVFVLDKTLVPQLCLQLEAHILLDVGISGSAERFALGLASCCWTLVYYCFLFVCLVFLLLFFFFLFWPFTRLEDRPTPKLIGLCSRVNSRAHTAWQLPPGKSRQAGSQAGWQQRLLQNFSKSKATPESLMLFDHPTPTVVQEILPAGA